MLHRLEGIIGVKAMFIAVCMMHILAHVSGQIGELQDKLLMIGVEWSMLLMEMVRIVSVALISSSCLDIGLSGEYCWMMSIQGASNSTAVQIKRGYIPDS